MSVLGQCSICGRCAEHTCAICGQLVCSRHYYPRERVCERCYRMAKHKIEKEDERKLL